MAKHHKQQQTKVTPKSEPEVAKAKASPAISEVKVEEDQKPAPEGTSGDQKDAPAKEKKKSNTVVLWREQLKKPFGPDQKITIIKENAKKNKAKIRFALYKNDMTVAEYQRVCSEAKVNTIKGAMSDMCWDVSAGLINIK